MDIHWYSDLVLMVGIVWDPQLGGSMGSYMVRLRYLHWESGHLVQGQEVR